MDRIENFTTEVSCFAQPPVDLAKLSINRDAPSRAERSALGRNLTLCILALLVVAATLYYLKLRNVPEVQVVTVSAGSASSTSGGGTSVTAIGYVVARTKASVSAKAAGRLEFPGVSEGSRVQKSQVIARLDNAD